MRFVARAARMTLLVAAMATAVSTSLVVAPVARATGGGPDAVRWGPCPLADPREPHDPRTECGTLRVPLDYEHPRGEAIEIAVSRLPATGLRRGVLLVNPGGPGTPGLDTPSQIEQYLPDIARGYDLVGFDPRGIRNSSPLTCGLTAAEVIEQLPYPDARGSIAGNVAYARSAAQRCAATAGPRIRFFTTANTARDMDRIRAALGQQRISYYGASAGTYLGAVYRSLFPGRVERMVLDSAADPTRIWYRQWRLWAPGLAVRFPDVVTAAVRDAATTGFGTIPAQVRASYARLLRQLDRTPVDVGAAVPLDGNLLRALTFDVSYSDDHLDDLMQVWRVAADLAAGSATAEERSGMAAVIASSAQSIPGIPVDNSLAAAYAVMCGDVAWNRNVASYQRAVTRDRARYPLTAGMPANIWPCAFWPYQPVERPVPIHAGGPRNVLVLQNERDPAVPLQSGLGMRRALGHAAALVRVDQGGHVVIATPNPCVAALLDAFLATPHRPVSDGSCPS